MFDRVKEIQKRWDAAPIGPWRVEKIGGRFLVRDAHGRKVLECDDGVLADTIAQSYSDMAYALGRVRELERQARDATEQSGDFLGKGHDGRVTLATYRFGDDEG